MTGSRISSLCLVQSRWTSNGSKTRPSMTTTHFHQANVVAPLCGLTDCYRSLCNGVHLTALKWSVHKSVSLTKQKWLSSYFLQILSNLPKSVGLWDWFQIAQNAFSILSLILRPCCWYWDHSPLRSGISTVSAKCRCGFHFQGDGCGSKREGEKWVYDILQVIFYVSFFLQAGKQMPEGKATSGKRTSNKKATSLCYLELILVTKRCWAHKSEKKISDQNFYPKKNMHFPFMSKIQFELIFMMSSIRSVIRFTLFVCAYPVVLSLFVEKSNLWSIVLPLFHCQRSVNSIHVDLFLGSLKSRLPWVWWYFLDTMPKSWSMENKVDDLDFTNMKKICTIKDNVRRIRRQARNQEEKVFAKDESDKVLY